MTHLLHDDPLRAQIIAGFAAMPPQLQQAARYILAHPEEVALVSMRRLARNAGVQPATMTRLAKALGLPGFDDLRARHVKALRFRAEGLSARAIDTTDQPAGAAGPAPGAAQGMLQGLAAQIARLADPDACARLEAAADRLATARRIFVLGLRSCHAVAWHFSYVAGLLGAEVQHLDGPAGTSGDGLIRAKPGDVLLAISISPYARQALELADLARRKGLAVVAITDSEVSPLAAIAEQAILCPTGGPGLFHSLAPAFVTAEVLCALLTGRDRARALAALRSADEQLLALDTYASAPVRGSPPEAP